MAQFASDAFTNTAGTQLPTHDAAWAAHPSYTTVAVISDADRVRNNTSAGTGGLYYHSGAPATADYSVSSDLFFKEANGGNGLAGVTGRTDTTANTYYMARYDGRTSDRWELLKVVAGVSTTLGTSAEAITDETSHNIKLEMVGSAIKLYKDGGGVATVSVTDTGITAAGKSGLFVYNSASANNTTGIHPDNFSADDVSASTPKTATSSLTAAVLHARTATASMSSAIQISRTATSGLDSAIQRALTVQAGLTAAVKALRTVTPSVDAAIRHSPSGTTALDAAIRRALTATASLDVAIKHARIATTGLDSYVLGGKEALTSLSAAILASRTALASVDAAIRYARTTSTGLSAGILERKTALATLNAYIFAGQQAVASLNAAIVERKTYTTALNAYILAGSLLSAPRQMFSNNQSARRSNTQTARRP